MHRPEFTVEVFGEKKDAIKIVLQVDDKIANTAFTLPSDPEAIAMMFTSAIQSLTDHIYGDPHHAIG